MTAIGSLRQQFCSLAPPALDRLTGAYRAEFIGPAWLRALAPPALALGGLAGWWGKTFDGQGGATNIVVRGGIQSAVLPMVVLEAPSRIDARPSLTLHYPAGSPFPWQWVIDEMRKLDDTTLLCVSMARPRPLVWLAFPFLLHQA